jgi:hypothetical protein
MAHPSWRRHQLDRRVRPAPGDHRIVGEPPEGGAAGGLESRSAETPQTRWPHWMGMAH